MEDQRSGYEAAFSELYDAYFERIYDFSIRLAQDREIAALAVQSTFLRALRATRAGHGDDHLQLYAGAHHDTAERLRARRGETEQFDEPYGAIDSSRLSMAVDDVPEFGRMVWSAAIELKLNDYEVLDLSVRHQLSLEDVATVLRARSESVERKLSDAHVRLEQAIRARLLFTRGRRECLDLDFQLGEGEWSNSLERRILRHSETCQVCRTGLETHPDASELLAALLPVPAPAGWKDTILERLQEAVRSEPMPTAPPAASTAEAQPSSVATATPSPEPEPAVVSHPAPEPVIPAKPLPEYGGRGGGGKSVGDMLGSLFGGGGSRGPLLGALLGGLLAVLVVIGSLCAAGTFDGGDDDELEPTATVTVTPTVEASGTPTATTTPTMTPTLEPEPEPTDPPEPTATEPLPTATEVVPEATPTAPASTATAPAPTEPPDPTATP